MSDQKTHIGAAEARHALRSIDEMKEAGLRRGIPPRWLGLMLAILIGGGAAAVIADLNGATNAAWIGAWSLAMITRRRALIVLARNMRTEISRGTMVAQVIGVILLVGSFVGGTLAVPVIGRGRAALLAGGGAALVVYVLFEFKRSTVRRKIELEMGH